MIFGPNQAIGHWENDRWTSLKKPLLLAAFSDSMQHKITLRPSDPWWRIDFKEIIASRDLIWFLFRRDFLAEYKQTVAGPLWFVLQPLGATLIFTFIFGRMAGLDTNGMPPFIFYHSGLILWTFFQGCVNGTSQSFMKNSALYKKVYFPRLISPLVEVLNSLWKHAVNFFIFLLFLGYYLFFTEANLHPNVFLWMVPLNVLCCGLLGGGLGMLFATLTVKYRDLNFVIPILLQFLMYLSPVIYASSMITGPLGKAYQLNPTTR